jgi:hypothetical protein
MGKKLNRKKRAKLTPILVPAAPRLRWRAYLFAIGLPCLSVLSAGIWYLYSLHATTLNFKNPTFAHDIAPLIYSRCSGCHHENGSAPFALMSYADVSKRAAQIVKVTQTRYMPPWLPEHGYGDFDGERYLSDDEIAMLKNWAAQGLDEGDPTRQPAPPHFNNDWQLGKPDMVVQVPHAYTLPAEGPDMYRNFVVPVPIPEDKFVKGIEFHAGSSRIHHAFIYIDPTPASRRREGKEPEPGWPGMGTLPHSAESPSTQFLDWQPGKIARIHEDTAWKLSKGTDIVLQLHMQPGGKPEPVQPSVALYFTDRPGTVHPMIALLRSADMDIPPGEKAYPVHANYTLPVDVNILGLLPHVHYLGKDLRAFATLPDGSRQWLLWIKNWDFNWQGEYTYKQPVFLPKGSRVEMEYTFDNSAENPRNPTHPPKQVRYGLQSTDEMAELWLLMLPRDEREAPILLQDRVKANMADSIAKNNALLRTNPSDGYAHLQLGKVYMAEGKNAPAEAHLRSAVQFDGENSETHYYLAYLLQDRIAERTILNECIAEYRRAIQLDRENYQALNGLGLTFLQAGMLQEAEACLIEALRVHPNDPLLEGNLLLVRKKKPVR